MKHKILVCYASISGSTGEVADWIAQTLQSSDVAVDVLSVRLKNRSVGGSP